MAKQNSQNSPAAERDIRMDEEKPIRGVENPDLEEDAQDEDEDFDDADDMDEEEEEEGNF